jgi:serine protease Do
VAGPSLRVVLADGRRYEGSVLRTDEYRQLALLKIDAQGLPHLTPAPSEHLQIGDAVLGLGNWFKIAEGEEPVSLTRGIVSLKTNLDARRLAQDVQYGGPVLVFDAITANPGAAGGPILDAQGRFVGLIGKIVEAAATNTRLNYALPAEELTAFLRADDPPAASAPGESAPPPTAGLPKRQPAARPYVGIKLSSLGYRHVAAFVERVRPDSPAALAGIKPDDLIVAIDGQRVADAQAYRQIIERTMPGQTVQFTIKRGQEVFNVAVTIGSEPQ